MILSEEEKLDFFHALDDWWDVCADLGKVDHGRIMLNEDFCVANLGRHYYFWSGPNRLFGIKKDGKFAYLITPDDVYTNEQFHLLYKVISDLVKHHIEETSKEEQINIMVETPNLKAAVEHLAKKYASRPNT